MARPPASKLVPESNGYKLPAPIKDPMQELLFLLGRLNGEKTETAERVTQLVLTLQEEWAESVKAVMQKAGEGEG